MKTTVVLPLHHETKGTVMYKHADPLSVAVGQVYVRKDHLEKGVNGAWPQVITVTIEVQS